MVAGGWLIVTQTEGGWFNIFWVLGPGGLLLLLFASLRLKEVDVKAKREALLAIGFEQTGDDEQQQISASICSMFEARSSVTVLASTTIQHALRCHLTEVTEEVHRGTGNEDNSHYVTSTVCLFEQNNSDTPPFRLAPHGNIAKTLLARLLSEKNSGTGFNDWYGTRETDGIQHLEILTPEWRDWLGKHSISSRMRPWTLVSSNGQLVAYRAGTVYTVPQFTALFTAIQELGELWNSSEQVAHVESVESTFLGTQAEANLPEDSRPATQHLQHLFDQKPPRRLAPYWIQLTRPRPVRMIVSGIVAAVAATIIPLPLMKLIDRTCGIEVPPPFGFAIAVGVTGLILACGLKWHWWGQRETRNLLRHGKLTHGIIDRINETGNREQDRSQFTIQVNFSLSGTPQTARCQCFVSDARLGVLDNFAKIGKQVVVLYDAKRPGTIVLPQCLAVCRE